MEHAEGELIPSLPSLVSSGYSTWKIEDNILPFGHSGNPRLTHGIGLVKGGTGKRLVRSVYDTYLVDFQVTENLNSDPLLELCQCPLCQLDCGSREQLIAHVYQVWTGEGSGAECQQLGAQVLQWPCPWLLVL